MDSILLLVFDRIYRIVWIFFITGFRMKPVMYNPLRGKSDATIRELLSPLLADKSCRTKFCSC